MYTATRTRKNRRADTQTTVAPDVTIRRASCRAKHTRDSIPRALNYPRRNSLRRPRWLWGSAEQQIIFSVSSGGRDPGLSGPAKTHGVCDPPPPLQNNQTTLPPLIREDPDKASTVTSGRFNRFSTYIPQLYTECKLPPHHTTSTPYPILTIKQIQ